MRRLFQLFVIVVVTGAPALAGTADRIAAVIDRQVLTVSEVNQMALIRFFPRVGGHSDDDYRHEILDALITQALRIRDVERFGAQDIPKDSIETRLSEIRARFSSATDFDTALIHAELTSDEVRALIKRQLQVEAYIRERFSTLIFVPAEEIDAYYKETWVRQRRDQGLPVPPLGEVRGEIASLLKSARLQTDVDQWTAQLRARANVDVYAWK